MGVDWPEIGRSMEVSNNMYPLKLFKKSVFGVSFSTIFSYTKYAFLVLHVYDMLLSLTVFCYVFQ